MLSRKDLTLNTLMILAMLSWGLSWTNAKLVGQYADAPLIMVWRFSIAAFSIAPILLITKILDSLGILVYISLANGLVIIEKLQLSYFCK